MSGSLTQRLCTLGAAWRAGAIATATVMAVTTSVSAQGIAGYPGTVEGFDAREVAMLPRWCIYTDTFRDRVPGGQNPSMIARWRAQMGLTFDAMHHYCYALMKTNRAVLLAKDEQTRTFYLQDSIREFDYVLNHAPTDFVMLPEILARKGQNLIRLGKGPVGLIDLERAIELNPTYWPPYAYLSDYYKTEGDLKLARQWLEQGLARAPDATGLKRRLSELGAPEPRATGKR
jgi:hypothetical protein